MGIEYMYMFHAGGAHEGKELHLKCQVVENPLREGKQTQTNIVSVTVIHTDGGDAPWGAEGR